MRIFVFLFLVKITSSQIFTIPNYEGAVDAMESEKNQEILKEIFPDYKKSGGRSGRIINGEIAELGEFPYQTLQYMTENGNNWYTCGGSLIHKNWVLTAAHCIEDFHRVDLYIGLVQRPPGFYQWTTIITGRNNLLIHPQRSSKDFSYDVGLLRLEDAPPNLLDLEYVGVVKLPSVDQKDIDLAGEIGLFSGFGRVNDSAISLSPVLRFAEAPIMENSECSEFFGPYIRPNTFCIDTKAKNTSSCSGDSGSPLTVTSILGEGRVQAGLVSFGASISCMQNLPSVFARITHFMDWIESTINPKSPPGEPGGDCNCNCHCHTCPAPSDTWRK